MGRRGDLFPPFPDSLLDALMAYRPTSLWVPGGGSLIWDVAGGWHATVTGSPTYGVAPPPIGRGVTWSGSGQYATTSASIPTPTATMSVWCLMSSTAVTSVTDCLSRSNTGQASWILSLSNTQKGRFQMLQSGGSAFATVDSTPTINDGALHSLGGTWDGTTIRVYLDGVLANQTATTSGTWHNASTAQIALAGRAAGTNLFAGLSALPAYWADRVVSAADMRFLHAIAFGG